MRLINHKASELASAEEISKEVAESVALHDLRRRCESASLDVSTLHHAPALA